MGYFEIILALTYRNSSKDLLWHAITKSLPTSKRQTSNYSCKISTWFSVQSTCKIHSESKPLSKQCFLLCALTKLEEKNRKSATKMRTKTKCKSFWLWFCQHLYFSWLVSSTCLTSVSVWTKIPESRGRGKGRNEERGEGRWGVGGGVGGEKHQQFCKYLSLSWLKVFSDWSWMTLR